MTAVNWILAIMAAAAVIGGVCSGRTQEVGQAALSRCGDAVALVIYQFGLLFTGSVNVIGLIFAIAIVAIIVYMLARPDPEKRVKAGGTLKARG